ncbi:MAG: hypothetical protein JY451_08090 [Erythrobacter sp.]|nr:MAG: hypothetical protein JY451_08090 [Erythrobacter sp.]
MAPPEDQKKISKPLKTSEKIKDSEPEWTSGLKRLYDSVLDEPLPDTFKALLSKLDENESK